MSDPIERQAAIDEAFEVETKEYGRIEVVGVDAINSLPPVTPKLATDVISRQAAIDALREAENHAFNSFYKGLKKAHKIIANLPSAQPEPQWMPLPEPYREDDTDYDYERAVDQLEHDIRWEHTFNPDDGSM